MINISNIVALLFIVFQTHGQDMSGSAISSYVPTDYFKPLTSTKNSILEANLIQKLRGNPEWSSLIKQKKLSVSLVDLNDLNAVRYAEVNGNVMMYAASLPKIAILLTAMDAIDKGEMEENDEIQADLKLMISKSDNHAATRMIDRLGYQKISQVLTNPKYNLYDRKQGGGLWVGKRYAASGDRNPDPIKGLSHAATALQVARFYYMLSFGKLVNQQRSEEMLEFLADPALHHKFVNTYDRIAPKARLYRKSGSWSVFHSDSIMVWGPSRHYILVALVEHPNGEDIIRKIGSAVDEVVLASH